MTARARAVGRASPTAIRGATRPAAERRRGRCPSTDTAAVGCAIRSILPLLRSTLGGWCRALGMQRSAMRVVGRDRLGVAARRSIAVPMSLRPPGTGAPDLRLSVVGAPSLACWPTDPRRSWRIRWDARTPLDRAARRSARLARSGPLAGLGGAAPGPGKTDAEVRVFQVFGGKGVRSITSIYAPSIHTFCEFHHPYHHKQVLLRLILWGWNRLGAAGQARSLNGCRRRNLPFVFRSVG